MGKILNRYAAAALLGLSPELLTWLTSYAPKQGLDRKLKVADKKGVEVFFDEEELRDFDRWLRAPWPHAAKKRPPIPQGIRSEVVEEAQGACAMCHAHAGSCEAAHIDPVSKSGNNHPHNLIWLCANHHTAYDKGKLKGLFGPASGDEDFVVGFKLALQRHRKVLWATQGDACRKAFLLLDACDSLYNQLLAATTPAQVKAIKGLAKRTLAAIPSLGAPPANDPNVVAFATVSAEVVALGKDTAKVKARLKKAAGIRIRYVAALGYVACPLCEGSGVHDGDDCPVCGGDRQVSARIANDFDGAEFEVVDCPVCDGEGVRNGEDCPACGGDARMQRRFAERIEKSDYVDVPCPLCGGSGKHKGDDCPECGGDGAMEARHAQTVEKRDYEDVDCPLCDGRGSSNGEDCPACHGERTMERHAAESIDVGQYAMVACPLCKGEGQYEGADCPECRGEREMARRHADNVDLHQYDMVGCPVCQGQKHVDGDDCRACDGEGEMQRRFAERD